MQFLRPKTSNNDFFKWQNWTISNLYWSMYLKSIEILVLRELMDVI